MMHRYEEGSPAPGSGDEDEGTGVQNPECVSPLFTELRR